MQTDWICIKFGLQPKKLCHFENILVTEKTKRLSVNSNLSFDILFAARGNTKGNWEYHKRGLNMELKIGVISDLHLFNKTVNIERSLSKLHGADLILIIGDIADHADEVQYNIFLNLIDEKIHDIPVYCVSGNHDNPAKNDANYRQFERKINNEYPFIVDKCGAFYECVNEYVDIIGLNPLYHQKQFYFSDKGRQLSFLREKLDGSSCKYHIVMCHPPLIAHNPQRTTDMASYIVLEQDTRFQRIIDDNKNMIILSGHTHVSPTIEFDDVHGNLYINNGSICPTMIKDAGTTTQQGNVTMLIISDNEITVIIEGIHSNRIFMEKHIATD